MNKYQRGKIYKIISNCSEDVYIGSTCEPTLARRLTTHRKDYKRFRDGKTNYVSSFDLLEKEHYEIVLIENFACESKDELHKRERYFIENTNNCVNRYIPSRNKKECDANYRQKHIEKISQQHKQYYKENKEKMLQQHKQYCVDNKEKLSQQMKKYYNNNKDKLFEPVKCVCGSETSKQHKARHEKSKKHIDYINSLGTNLDKFLNIKLN